MESPLVMGILNVTPDSFYAGSRVEADSLCCRVVTMMDEGVDIIDIGACSTRPGAVYVDEAEELDRLHKALELLDDAFPNATVSLDTFRSSVARECLSCHNVSIINDVSGFSWDEEMLDFVAEANIPYVLTHSVGDAASSPEYKEFLPEVIAALSQKMWKLRQRGVKDVIIDPGFGFGKSLEQNYCMMANLREFSILDAPLLVGVSRKSMITRALDVSPVDALNGTTALNMIALQGGANILRVHDVRAAREAVMIYEACNNARFC